MKECEQMRSGLSMTIEEFNDKNRYLKIQLEKWHDNKQDSLKATIAGATLFLLGGAALTGKIIGWSALMSQAGSLAVFVLTVGSLVTLGAGLLIAAFGVGYFFHYRERAQITQNNLQENQEKITTMSLTSE